ncbi:MAG: hypothetical protein R2755_10795 [Acidimicrobiales bacterium]
MRQALRGVPALVVVLVCAVALAAGAGAWRASRQAPLPPSLEGPCSVRAELLPTATVIDPAVSAGVYPVPPAGTVRFDAVLSDGADRGRRRLQGSVRLDLPPPFGDATLASWDEDGGRLDTSGSRAYALPARWVPAGLTLTVHAEHREPGLRCAGSLQLRVSGSTTGSVLRPTAVVLLVATAWLLARAAVPRPRRHDPWLGRLTGDERWAARGRPGFGAVSGLLFGLAAALVLLLTSAVPLGSAWVSAAPLLGALAGIGLGWWGPAGSDDDASSRPVADEGRELAILEPLGDD